MQNKNALDEFFKGLGDAITDIREKVVEEPWYGRSLSDRESSTLEWPQAREPEPADARDVAAQDQDREIDR
jgi:hypothetical protein